MRPCTTPDGKHSFVFNQGPPSCEVCGASRGFRYHEAGKSHKVTAEEWKDMVEDVMAGKPTVNTDLSPDGLRKAAEAERLKVQMHEEG